MAELLNLKKGELLNLKKDSFKKLNIGLGWDITNGRTYDIDAFVLCFDNSDRYLGKVYYGMLYQFGIKHFGDNLTGEGDGDDETIQINLEILDSQVKKIRVFANIFAAGKSTFNEIDNAFIRLYNPLNNEELAIYKLSEQNRNFNAFHFADLDIVNNEIKFSIVAEGLNGNIDSIVDSYVKNAVNNNSEQSSDSQNNTELERKPEKRKNFFKRITDFFVQKDNS